jgi:hypothetical protein
MNKPTSFPDISDIVARKAEGRKAISRLSFGEKIERMESLRKRLSPFKQLRQSRSVKR